MNKCTFYYYSRVEPAVGWSRTGQCSHMVTSVIRHIKLWVGILLTLARFFYPFMGIVIVDSIEALLL